MDSGTGCVHTAPGFGADDYETCKRYGMDMVVPVDDQGRHTDYAGKYAGMTTEASNPVILAGYEGERRSVRQRGHRPQLPPLLALQAAHHLPGHPQWFCSVDSFKDEAIAACEDVRWVPAWGRTVCGMILERTDWCICRQRRWGLPIPCSTARTAASPSAPTRPSRPSELFGKEGSNAWFDRDAADILPKGFTCPHCGKAAGFDKETDTLDGWFDSGSTHFASMERTRASGLPPCTWRAWTSTAAGSSPPC